MKDEFYVPEINQVRLQSKVNKQGSEGQMDESLATDSVEKMQREQLLSYEQYEEYLESGMAKELARVNLPLSLYTEKYWQMDLNNLFKFLSLRMDGHAQYEIRVYANAIYELTKSVAPWACEAFEEYIWGAVTFSKKEMELTRFAMLRAGSLWPTEDLEKLLGKTGAIDFLKKING